MLIDKALALEDPIWQGSIADAHLWAQQERARKGLDAYQFSDE